MRVLDLFAGIGGFSLAAHWMGWETAAFVEWDKFCQKVLAKNFPNVPIYGDIKDFHYEQEREKIGPVDLICGGFPCQPFSHAGKRNGTADDRYLWPEMLRVIREVKPTGVVGENVAGLLSMDGGAVFEEICSSLEAEGYAVEAFVLPAISRGAPHRRDRVWIVAQNAERRRLLLGTDETWNGRKEQRKYKPANEVWGGCICGADITHGFTADAEITECESSGRTWTGREGFANDVEHIGNPNKPRLERCGGYDQRPGEWFIWKADSQFNPNTPSERRNKREGRAEWLCEDAWQGNRGDQWREHWYEAATRLCGVHDGLSRGVDRSKRLKSLGNAIVPQVVYEIFRAIEAANRQ